MFAVLLILGLISIVYGIAIMLVWSGTLFFAIWYVIGACLIAAAFAHRAGFFERLSKGGRRALVVLGCLVPAGAVFFAGLAVSSFAARPDGEVSRLIVLGAQVHESEPSVVLRYRLDAACEYMDEHEDVTCIVSGGQGANEPAAEAHVMKSYMERWGIASERIVVEDESLSTAENIENSKRLLTSPEERVAIVTNNFHMYRALAIAHKKGLVNVSGLAAPSHAFYLPNNVLREMLGIAKDFAFGNLDLF